MIEKCFIFQIIMSVFFFFFFFFLKISGCSFLTKSKIAQRGGAVAAIIMDDDGREIDRMIDMADDNTGRTVEIPSAFLTGKDG